MTWPFIVAFVVLLALGLEFPRYTPTDDDAAFAKYSNLRANLSLDSHVFPFPVMTLNIRHDLPESNPDNNFENRLARVDALIRKWNPLIIGLQEPFKTQIDSLLQTIPEEFKVLAYERLPDSYDGEHVTNHSTALLYNSKELLLQGTDFIWLSSTPRKESSVDWGAYRPRSLNIARFKYKGVDVIAFNTHLDRWSELARREQAKVAQEAIREWQKKFPNAMFVHFGDFNTVPGQEPHKIMTEVMNDTWVWCKQNDELCVSNDFSSTYHGWLGTIVNTWIGRALQTFLYTLHGMGVSPPSRHRALPTIVWDFVFGSFSPIAALPKFPFDRFHVDWILFQAPRNKMTPVFVAVVDVRSTNFSSDHFPVVALYSVVK